MTKRCAEWVALPSRDEWRGREGGQRELRGHACFVAEASGLTPNIQPTRLIVRTASRVHFKGGPAGGQSLHAHQFKRRDRGVNKNERDKPGVLSLVVFLTRPSAQSGS